MLNQVQCVHKQSYILLLYTCTCVYYDMVKLFSIFTCNSSVDTCNYMQVSVLVSCVKVYIIFGNHMSTNEACDRQTMQIYCQNACEQHMYFFHCMNCNESVHAPTCKLVPCTGPVEIRNKKYYTLGKHNMARNF